MVEKCVIACSKRWFINYQHKFVSHKNFIIITDKKKINLKNLKKINPKYIFFPHWSHIIKKEIYNNFFCIGFHSSDLPYGRGGSPIQNQIIRKMKSTKLTSIIIDGYIVSGYWRLKTSLKLSGSIEDIFRDLSKIIKNQIVKILKNKIKLKKQNGKITKFKRLNIENSKLKTHNNLENIFDQIRMVDSEEYPRAFIKIGKFKIEFSEAKYFKNKIICKTTIK